MFVRCVDIDRIVNHHYLNLLFNRVTLSSQLPFEWGYKNKHHISLYLYINKQYTGLYLYINDWIKLSLYRKVQYV